MPVGRDGQYAKSLPAEILLVLLAGVGGEIRPHLALEARLQKIGAGNGHRAAVDLDHKAAAGAIGKLQTEHKIRDKPDLMHGSVMCEADAER